MEIQQIYWMQNTWFAAHIFGAMVLLAVGWLYWDAWIERKYKRELFKITGFLVLSLSFALSALNPDSSNLGAGLNMPEWLVQGTLYLRLTAYSLLVLGLKVEPLQPKPKAKVAAVLPVPSFILGIPLMAAGVGLLYWRRATLGLERHVGRIALSFFILSLAELGWFLPLLQHTRHLWLYLLVQPYGVLWTARVIVLSISFMVLFSWVWRYLLLRLMTQLVLIFSTATFLIFMITTAVFTGLLLRNIEKTTILR